MQGSKNLMDNENEVADAVTLAGDGTEKEQEVNTIQFLSAFKENIRVKQ